ncbi:hypothetical protein VTO73DRAFT_10346 [Trametes versicolor]
MPSPLLFVRQCRMPEPSSERSGSADDRRVVLVAHTANRKTAGEHLSRLSDACRTPATPIVRDGPSRTVMEGKAFTLQRDSAVRPTTQVVPS